MVYKYGGKEVYPPPSSPSFSISGSQDSFCKISSTRHLLYCHGHTPVHFAQNVFDTKLVLPKIKRAKILSRKTQLNFFPYLEKTIMKS